MIFFLKREPQGTQEKITINVQCWSISSKKVIKTFLTKPRLTSVHSLKALFEVIITEHISNIVNYIYVHIRVRDSA